MNYENNIKARMVRPKIGLLATGYGISHKTIMNMPFDWPRINQFPEWFTPEKNGNYELIDFREEGEQIFSDQQLIDGISLSLQKGVNQFILKKKK